jgi:hypothetical protein
LRISRVSLAAARGQVPERRPDVVAEQVAVVLAGRWLERRGGLEPLVGPLPERDATGGRVDVGTAELRVLHRQQEPVSVELACERLRVLFAGRVTPASP